MLNSATLPDNVILFPIARALNIALFRDITNLSLTINNREKIIKYTNIGKSYLSRLDKIKAKN